ncbi:MAG: AraC family transcriptional regulator [Lachnospiraceae bacterium]|nr:AraC family transcriptional regulator [Lachnospiraceae bacterium]
MIENQVVNKAIDYIMKHVGEEINIDDVAEYCHFSKYYFSRMFKAETGESIYAFIKRAKIEQSAFKLKVERNKKVTDIGYEYGYSPSNYSSVFKQQQNTSPVAFRKLIYEKSLHHPFYHVELNHLESFEECNQKVSIEEVNDYFVIYERRKGNYHNLSLDWESFLEKYKEYVAEDTLLMERTFDDPSITDADNCLYDICISVDRSCPLENTCVIQGGKYAVYHFTGLVQQIYGAYQNLFTVWFPNTPYEIDERYGFEIYREVNCDTMEMRLDIYFPIR